MAVDVGSAVGYLDLDISRFLAGLKSAQSEADAASKNIATKIGNNFQSVGKGLSSVGTTLTKNVTAPIAAVGVAGLKVATDFEKGMSEVKAISGATGDDFTALRNKAIELGADTAFSANEVADAMSEMAKAGWNSKQIIDGMGGVLAAAAASGEELSTVSTIVADTITGFGLAASDSTKVADLLTQAANAGTIEIGDLGESFKYVAPLANAMGISVEDAVTAISAMSTSGIKGSQAGTALSGVLSRLNGDNEKVRSTMKELGIEITNADGSFKSLDDIVAVLRDSFSGMTDDQKAYYATILAGQEGQKGLLALLNLSEDEYNKIAESMNNAGGVAEKTAATMQDNLQSKVEQLGGSLESLAIKLSDYVIPNLQKFVEWLTDLVDKFTNLDPGTQKAILMFAAIAAAIGPVLIIFGKLTSSVGSIITTFGKIPAAITKIKGAFTTVSTAIGGISAPVVVVVAIIGILIAAFVHLWKTNEDFRNKMTIIWNSIKINFELFAQGIVDRLNALGFDFENFGEVIKAIWDGFCSLLAPILEGAFNQIKVTLKTVFDVLTGIFDVFIGIFTGNWDQAWKGVKEIFDAVWNFIKNTFSNVITTILSIFGTTKKEISTKWTELWQNVKDWFKEKWNEMLTFFSELPYKIGYWLGQVIGKAIIWAKEFPEKAKTAVTKFVDNIKKWLTELPEKVKSWLDKVLTKTAYFIILFPLKAKMAAQEFKEKLTNGLKEIPEKMKSIGKNIVEGIWNGIKNAKQWLIDKFKSFASGITDGLKDALGIHSPSTVMEKEVGKFMPPGIANGFIKSMPAAISKMQSALNKNLNKLGTKNIETDATTDLMVDSLKSKYEELALWFESVEQRVNKSIQGMIYSLFSVSNGSLLDTNLGYIGYNGFKREPSSIGGFENKSEPTQSNGNTFIFNSPEPINAIEAARLVRKTEKDIIEGF